MSILIHFLRFKEISESCVVRPSFGVPQGSVLGTFIYFFYKCINLFSYLGSKCILGNIYLSLLQLKH